MCIDMSPRKAASPTPEPAKPGSTCFTASRLNGTTFQIVEDDKFLEMPIIYAKVYRSVFVLMDTGCGGAARDPSVELRSLRSFLETVPVKDNGEAPLNSGGEREYLVICTHCHFDHISEYHDIKVLGGWILPNFFILVNTVRWHRAVCRDGRQYRLGQRL